MPDHDPFETFKAAMSTDLRPLPATEVRRRGNRLRRRNTALAVAGGTVAAMTAIGVPIALTQGDDPDTDSLPVATDGPTTDAVGWRSEIPDDFPVLTNMPETNEGSGTPVQARSTYEPQAPGPCGGPAWDVTGALDTLQAVWSGTEGGLDRTLSVFEDESIARARLTDLSRQARFCDSPRIRVDWVQQDLGEQSVVFANVWDDGTAYLHQAIRVGNAVLYSTSYFNGAGDPDVVEQTRELEQERSAEVVTEMCVFSADPC